MKYCYNNKILSQGPQNYTGAQFSSEGNGLAFWIRSYNKIVVEIGPRLRKKRLQLRSNLTTTSTLIKVNFHSGKKLASTFENLNRVSFVRFLHS